MTPFIYPGIKLVAYTLWSYLALRYFRPQQPDLLSRSLVYGFLRLLMGLFFGGVIFVAGLLILSVIGTGLPQNALTYVLIYIPVRWVEWSLMAALVVPGSFPFVWRVVGTSPEDRTWRLVGIIISCLADIPMIIAFGGVIPTGRILC
jgi:hypothetical protein